MPIKTNYPHRKQRITGRLVRAVLSVTLAPGLSVPAIYAAQRMEITDRKDTVTGRSVYVRQDCGFHPHTNITKLYNILSSRRTSRPHPDQEEAQAIFDKLWFFLSVPTAQEEERYENNLERQHRLLEVMFCYATSEQQLEFLGKRPNGDFLRLALRLAGGHESKDRAGHERVLAYLLSARPTWKPEPKWDHAINDAFCNAMNRCRANALFILRTCGHILTIEELHKALLNAIETEDSGELFWEIFDRIGSRAQRNNIDEALMLAVRHRKDMRMVTALSEAFPVREVHWRAMVSAGKAGFAGYRQAFAYLSQLHHDDPADLSEAITELMMNDLQELSSLDEMIRPTREDYVSALAGAEREIESRECAYSDPWEPSVRERSERKTDALMRKVYLWARSLRNPIPALEAALRGRFQQQAAIPENPDGRVHAAIPENPGGRIHPAPAASGAFHVHHVTAEMAPGIMSFWESFPAKAGGLKTAGKTFKKILKKLYPKSKRYCLVFKKTIADNAKVRANVKAVRQKLSGNDNRYERYFPAVVKYLNEESRKWPEPYTDKDLRWRVYILGSFNEAAEAYDVGKNANRSSLSCVGGIIERILISGIVPVADEELRKEAGGRIYRQLFLCNLQNLGKTPSGFLNPDERFEDFDSIRKTLIGRIREKAAEAGTDDAQITAYIEEVEQPYYEELLRPYLRD